MPADRAVAGARRLAQAGAVAAGVVVLDQVSKAVIGRRFLLGEILPVVDGVLAISNVRNPGVAFGLLAGLGAAWRIPFFLTITAVAGWLLVKFYPQVGHLARGRAAIGLIAGGAAGNLIDRLRYGQVVDFIDVWIGAFHWPTFNLADSAITIGLGLLIWIFWRLPAPDVDPA